MEPVFQSDGVEVDQVPQPDLRKSQVGEHLRLMDRRHGVDRFDFDNDLAFDPKVKPEPDVEA